MVMKAAVSEMERTALCTVEFLGKNIAALEKQDFGIKTRLLKSLRCLIKVTIKKERG